MPRNYKSLWDKYPKSGSVENKEHYNVESESPFRYLILIGVLFLSFLVILGSGYGFWILLNILFE